VAAATSSVTEVITVLCVFFSMFFFGVYGCNNPTERKNERKKERKKVGEL
jgi:hypothetical protein